MRYFLFIFIILNLMNVAIASVSNNNQLECPKINEARKQLDPWVLAALKSDYSIGCPTGAVNEAISELETISRTQGKCKEEAIGTLIAIFTIFNAHRDYKMCGFQQKEDALFAYVSVDGEVCKEKVSASETVKCFNKVAEKISLLKYRGALTEAFVLAKKAADSNDPSGLIQLMLGLMYENGEGTEKNVTLAIEWFKKAAERLDDEKLRKIAIIALSVTYEEIHDYKSAEQYALQCAAMGDSSCKNGLNRIRKMYHL
ncbi:MAG TPA: tetratricopeptide repeat protein [Gammaproteobacteria bacterium]|nr:tetratricopeptide repeat protein [Gammaproteobacteria bacterium]